MSEWREVRIGDVCKVGDGAHTKVARQEKGILYLTSKNFDTGRLKLEDVDFISEDDYERLFPEKSKAVTRLQPNDVLMGIIGTFGNAYRYKETDYFGVSSSVAIIRPNASELNADFLVYLLNSEKFKYVHRAYSSGSVQGYSNIPTIKQMPLCLPSVQIQEEIVAVLSCLDRKIENLRRQNETLERIAQTLFKHWFIDFEFPNADGKPYKSSGGAMERSELGEIPAGWQRVGLGDVATNHSETHQFRDIEQVVFINTGDVLEGNFLHHDYSSISLLPGQAKKKIRKDDILYSEIRPINRRFAYVNFSENIDDYVVSTKFMVVRSNGKILPRLLYLILIRDSTIQEFHYIADSRSGTFPQITFESVSTFPIIIPDLEEQKRLMSTITPLLEKREFNIQQIQTLTQTRDVLLPKLMSGKLRVKELSK